MKTSEVKIQVQTETETKNLSGDFCAGIVVKQLEAGTNTNQYCVGVLSLASTVAAITGLKSIIKTLHDSLPPEKQLQLDLMLAEKSAEETGLEDLFSNNRSSSADDSDASPDLDKLLGAILSGIFGGEH